MTTDGPLRQRLGRYDGVPLRRVFSKEFGDRLATYAREAGVSEETVIEAGFEEYERMQKEDR